MVKVELIDEDIKNQILAKLPMRLSKWSRQKMFAEPRPRWFKIDVAEHDGVHYIVSIMVGKDKKETWQMANELIDWHKKYVTDQKDVVRIEDYTVEKY